MSYQKAKNRNKKWTEEERDYLLDILSSSSSIERAASMLGRTVPAVNRELERMKIGTLSSFVGAFTTYELSDIISVDPKTILQWIKTRGLPSRQIKKHKSSSGVHYYSVNPDDFWRWAKKNKSLVPFSNIKRGILLPEPDWLEEAVAADNLRRGASYFWSIKEDKELYKYYQQGLTQVQIGLKMNRSRSSIQKRLARLKKDLPYYLRKECV